MNSRTIASVGLESHILQERRLPPSDRPEDSRRPPIQLIPRPVVPLRHGSIRPHPLVVIRHTTNGISQSSVGLIAVSHAEQRKLPPNPTLLTLPTLPTQLPTAVCRPELVGYIFTVGNCCQEIWMANVAHSTRD
ncbi:unnamed protein product [Protopolystoma xenopodis]|uniref:Uncharacterized protein n=1 Tax=Protopolystoma xenopodis TaxID=117903 RepID=A0A3S5BTV7_9PLAT|nr:unnamed protein product [Protopolystoma xenopodis]